ncbi:Osmotin, thaumatin-like protein [Auricularia subglabra TFB-10046 SS5]|uniref:Osmotin, thaumatin-like protein n=1 Tax=Auricularia subglabra (strain TFB-10046 / SS5) TaxID=717982 RepID=J0WRS9_AURST|nr:Osmotin, thaumatin-like protein [Auricularia subglabra TFB-10046 SS5]
MIVRNSCPFTVWSIFTDPGQNTVFPDTPTGWQADPFTSTSFTVPQGWRAGRIWGRRDCNFAQPATSPADTQCVTGGCSGGGVLCQGAGGIGAPPATLAEWTLDDPQSGNDFYDVSLVDGYNLPMSVETNAGCPIAGCFVDLGPGCPDQLKGPFDATGFPVGCKTACLANLDGNPSDSANCCSGSHNTPATCPVNGVQFYSYFKNACPDSYAYAYDEASGTALWTCPSHLRASYIVTFCPANNETFTFSTQSGGPTSGASPTFGEPSATEGGPATQLPASGSPTPTLPFVNPNEGLDWASPTHGRASWILLSSLALALLVMIS